MAERLERDTTAKGAGDALEFERELAPRCPAAPAAGAEAPDRLEFCPRCHRDLVYPLDWAPAGARRWRVALRCPGCEWHSEGTFGQEAVDRFDEALDEGTQELLADLERLTRANLAGEAERFAAALARDLILPEDF